MKLFIKKVDDKGTVTEKEIHVNFDMYNVGHTIRAISVFLDVLSDIVTEKHN